MLWFHYCECSFCYILPQSVSSLLNCNVYSLICCVNAKCLQKHVNTPHNVARISTVQTRGNAAKIHLKFSLIIKDFSQWQQAHKNWLLFKSEVVWIKSQSGISRSRRCLPFLLSVFVTNFNNIWHSINFSLLKDTRPRLHFSPSNVLKMSWILSRKNGLTSGWQWSLQMASLFSPLFCPNREKQINNVGCCFSFTFLSLPSRRWPFC